MIKEEVLRDVAIISETDSNEERIDFAKGLNVLFAKKIVRHFKGNYYIIEGIAFDCNSEQIKVVYRSLYGDNNLWTRDWEEFNAPVPDGKPNPAGNEFRFDLVENMSVSEYEIGD